MSTKQNPLFLSQGVSILFLSEFIIAGIFSPLVSERHLDTVLSLLHTSPLPPFSLQYSSLL